MAVSGGYPGNYQKDFTIQGLTESTNAPGVIVFQAGTGFKDNAIVTKGGRVITATAQGRTLKEAVEIAQNVLSNIQFEGMYFRRDIGYEFES
jgi:phosphoribosylamine--glycine ligase